MITNRTAGDVSSAEEIRQKYQALNDWTGLTADEVLQLERGTYSINTLNRVENAVENLKNSFNAMGYIVSVVTKIWQHSEIMQVADLDRYLSNIQTLRNVLTLYQTTPQVPNGFSPHTKANDIEKILVDIESIIFKIKAVFIHSGTTYSGMEGIRL